MITKRIIWLVAFAATAAGHGIYAKPASKPNFIYAENGVYYYEAAVSRNQSDAGQGAGDAVGYRYYGTNSQGEHILANVRSNGSVIQYVYCKNPCRVVRTSGGDRFVNNSRLVVYSAFSDAFRGRLRNTNPETISAKVNIPSVPPVNRTFSADGIAKAGDSVSIRAAVGAPVYATADGVVEFAGEMAGNGNVVRIDHGRGIKTLYGRLNGKIVLPGTRVKRGQLIGIVAAPTTGNLPALLYGVIIDGKAVDPMPFLQPSD